MSINGQNKKLDQIHDKVDFVSDSIVPLSSAINKNTLAVEENSRSINNLATQIQHFLEYHIKTTDRDRVEKAEIHKSHRLDLIKIGGILFLILFGMIFGFKEIPTIARALF